MSERRPMPRGFAYGALAGLIAGLAIAAAVAFAAGLLDDAKRSPVDEAREVIEDNYFERVSSESLDRASIRGMVEELRDHHRDRFSHYFTPDQLEEFHSATSGKFEGIGLTVNEVRRGLRVVAVLPNTPAEEAEIRSGDLITAVDGRSIAGLPADVSTARIKGPPGTEVRLRVVTPGERPRELEVERAEVRIPAVEGRLRRAGGHPVAYVDFRTFSDGAHGELRRTLERLYRRGAEGAIVDLRNNGGGLLNEAVLSASVFVEDGVIVTTESRTRGERVYEAVGDALEPRPMVVLTSRHTASAAEILAAALAEHDLATIVGQRTFGKGSFQEVIALPSGGALDLTIGRYLTADGTSLADRGLEPDVRAADDPETGGRDEGLRRGLRVLAREL